MSLPDDIQLIEEVKKYPLLFDSNAKGFKDHTVKDKAWIRIAAKLHVKPLEARNRWKNLRDRFVREKKIMSSECESETKSAPWPLLEHMSFMWNFIIHRRRYASNTVKSELSNYQAISTKRDATEWITSLDEEVDNNETKSKRQKTLFYQEQSIDEAPDLYNVPDTEDEGSYSQKTEQCINSQSYVADEQHYFCMSVAETLRRFTQRQSAEAKLKIQQILYETEFSDANTTFQDTFIEPQ